MRRVLVILVALCPFVASAVELPAERERWTAMRFEELTILSNAGDRETRDVVDGVLRLRDALAMTTKMQVRAPLPTTIFVFRDDRNYAPYRNAAMGRRVDDTAGIFLGSRDGNFVLMSAQGRDASRRVIYHEMTHYFLHNSTRDLPAWLDEGFAEFYAGFDASGDAIKIGLPHDDHLALLKQEPPMPLAQLFAIDHRSKDYNEGSRRGVFYCESWALVHYLMIGSDERHAQFPVFLELLGERQPVDDAFRTAFHCTYEQMEHELQKYVRQYTMAYARITSSDLKAKEPPKPSTIARDEALFHLADMLAHSDPSALADATAFAGAAAKANPSNADAQALLAVIAARQGRFDEAQFDRAVKLEPKDAMPYLAYGDAILERVNRAINGGGEPEQADVVKARALFVKATQLAPGDPRGWTGTGDTYVVDDGDVSDGIAAFQKSFQLAAADEFDSFNLMSLYLRAGRAADAKALMESSIRPSRNERVIAAAEERLAFTAQLDEFNRAVKVAEAGKYDEALSIVDALSPKVTDRQLAAHIKDFREQVKDAKTRN